MAAKKSEVTAVLKLSIVVPIYKVEDYLPACLDSILLPEREDYEIIAVDDGSPDRSGQIAEEYAARYPGLIRVIVSVHHLCKAIRTPPSVCTGSILPCCRLPVPSPAIH